MIAHVPKYHLFLLPLFLSFALAAQESQSTRTNMVGWNAISILVNGLNFFGQTNIYNNFDLGIEAGYQFGPGAQYKPLYDPAHSHQPTGAFLKINPLFVIPQNNFRAQAGPVYVGSFYDESAIYEVGKDQRLQTARGFAHGVGLHVSVDIFVFRGWGLRLGMQQGFSFRKEYARSSTVTYEPGLGAEMMGPHHQGFLGFFYSW